MESSPPPPDARTGPASGGRAGYVLALNVLLVSLLVLCVAGARHDYVLFLGHWQIILDGHDPWLLPNGQLTGNAYGPVHIALAWLVPLHPLAPKIVYGLAWAVLAAWLFHRNRRDPRATTLLAACLTFPFLWVEIALWGHMEPLMALFAALSYDRFRAGRDVQAGALLCLAVAVKYVPALMLPFYLLHRGRVRAGVLGGFLLAAALVYGGVILRYGLTFLAALEFGATRASMHFSFFRFLRGELSPVAALGWDVEWLSVPTMLVCAAAVFAAYARGRYDVKTAIVATTLTSLTFYKVGFAQYYGFYCLLLLFFLFRHPAAFLATPGRYWWVWLNPLYIGIGSLVFALEYELRWPLFTQLGFREWGGLGHLVVSAISLYCLLGRRLIPWPTRVA